MMSRGVLVGTGRESEVIASVFGKPAHEGAKNVYEVDRGLSLCAAAQVALLIWGRHIRGDVLSGLRIGVGVAMVGFGFALAFHAHERSQSGSSIQTRFDELKVRQANLKTRFDALLAESEKAPNDPAVLKSLGARHLELMKEDEALKKDVDEIQYELNAMKE